MQKIIIIIDLNNMYNKISCDMMGETNEKVDGWYKKIQDYLTKKIGSFVAFLFVLYALGALTAIFVMTKYPQQAYLVVIIPAIAGIVAYYNRAFATFIFFALVISVIFL
ncbi:MAG: hypothetical protein PHP82_04465 [Candidatus ainarchaeum sp.]|nr:hypothetical protein [Candidatus ainarchaeum sp.]